MGIPFSSLVRGKENWIRCGFAVNVHIKECTLDILHNRNHDPLYQGLPFNPANLYTELKKHFTPQKVKDLEKKGILKKDQKDLILPANGLPNSIDWDITLITLVITTCLTLPEILKKAVENARNLRNAFNHASFDEFKSQPFFAKMWNDIDQYLSSVKYSRYTEFQKVKTDPFLKEYINAGENSLQQITNDIQNKLSQKVQNNETEVKHLLTKKKEFEDIVKILQKSAAEQQKKLDQHDHDVQDITGAQIQLGKRALDNKTDIENIKRQAIDTRESHEKISQWIKTLEETVKKIEEAKLGK